MKFCSFASGSSGNCFYIASQDTKLLIDVGISGKRVTNSLKEVDARGEELDGILVTHDHIDHIKGVGIVSRKYKIPIYANSSTWKAMAGSIGEVHPDHIRYFESDRPFEIKDLRIEPFRTSHDAVDPVGFSISGNNKKISVATDLGVIDDTLLESLYGSDLVVLEANHDVQMLTVGPYPYFLKRRILSNQGHLSNESAGRALVKLVQKGLTRVLLAHLSKENNFPELAYQTVHNILAENSIGMDRDISIEIAQREKLSPIYSL